ncbi:MAG TPA: hypothetical protein VFG11_09295 [Acidobacteriota bacterium]|nr:hypothetical protein [Acidobacteriota bacterium]
MLDKAMHWWEHKLSQKDRNRTTLPFEWGFEYLNHGFAAGPDPLVSLLAYNESMISQSDEFFRHTPPNHFQQNGDRVLFPSSVASPHPQNNTAIARYFPAKQKIRRAVLVLPQWNADPESHVSLCRVLNRLGYSALRLTLPYHEERNPQGPRADYLVSANLGRTIAAIQQAVCDSRSAVDWLVQQGYERIGIAGSSVGSCIAYLTYLHESRLRVGVFNHVSSFFGDVVWNGISTRHVRAGFQDRINRDQLRRAWAIISPNSHVARLKSQPKRKMLFISARYDLTFPPDLAQLLFEEHDRCGVSYDTTFLPCGHYTSARWPFVQLDGYHITQYFRKYL